MTVAELTHAPEQFEAFLLAMGDDPTRARQLEDGLYVLARRLMFHWTLIIGEVGDLNSYLDRWCYQHEADAMAAMRAWDGQSDPPGPWHRHPNSGRRRPDGDASREHQAW